MELEFQLSGTVVPAVPPFLNQKSASIDWMGRLSPPRIELLVPSVTLPMFTTCRVS